MGAKYSSQATSGYNASAPSDDGTQSASNLITWAGIKTKLTDVLKTFGEAINTSLVTAFDYSVRQISSSDSTVAGDHMRTVEIAPTVSSSITISLGDAATMTNNYAVWIKNSSTIPQTIGRVTASDTVDGAAVNITLPSLCSMLLKVNSGATGYLIAGASGDALGSLSGAAGTNTVTANGAATSYKLGQSFELTPASTNTGATTLNINSIGAKNIFANGAALTGGELVAGVPVRLKYDGTQFNLIGFFPSAAQTFLGSDVALNNTANYFNVVNTGSIGASGQVWQITATVTCVDTGGAALFRCRIWDGSSSVYACQEQTSVGASSETCATIAATVTLSAATTFHLSIKDSTATTGKALTTGNADTANKSTSITAVRLR
jgi:hypothetical protein